MFESKLPESLIPKGPQLSPGDKITYYSSHFKTWVTGKVLKLEVSADYRYKKGPNGNWEHILVGNKEKVKVSVDKLPNTHYGYTINVNPSKLLLVEKAKVVDLNPDLA